MFILDLFDLSGFYERDKNITIHLEEKAVKPEAVDVLKAVGFTEPKKITDFPIRGRLATLSVKRRRWLINDTKTGKEKKISRDFHILKQGTSMTSEFAAFLKGID